MKKALFCLSGGKNKGLSLENAAEVYDSLTKEYDSMIAWHSKYEKFSETSDITKCIGEKDYMTLMFTLFSTQAIKRIGNAKGDFISSSYIFNLERNDCYAPSFDVVFLEGNDINPAINEVEKLYKNYGWNTSVVDRQFESKQIESENHERKNKISIINPLMLLEYAANNLCYDTRDIKTHIKNQ